MTYILLRLAHLLFMALWLAAILKEYSDPLTLDGDSKSNQKLNTQREREAGLLGTVSGMGTLLSGGALLYTMGFSNAPMSIHIGLALTLAMAFMGAFGVGGIYHKMAQALDNKAPASQLTLLRKKLKIWARYMLVTWLAVFLLMGLRHFI